MQALTQYFNSSRSSDRWLSRHFKVPLVNLGDSDPQLLGIYTPQIELGAQKIGLSEQFQANAGQYASRYAASDDATEILGNALNQVRWRGRSGMTILDIGTGSGANSVVPCLRLFEQCNIVATDLSTELLALLRHYLVIEKLDDRVACVCTDSMRDHFKPARFDMVVGSAILHHLIDPQMAINAAFKALKPGGLALFVEPFEGFSILGHAFSRMLSDGRDLPKDTAEFLKAMCVDMAARKGSDKSQQPHFQYMDDKWLFTRTYIENTRRVAGFASVTIVPYLHRDAGRHYRNSTEILLRCGGLDHTAALPEWAWLFIQELDLLFSSEMKQDALLEGVVIYRK